MKKKATTNDRRLQSAVKMNIQKEDTRLYRLQEKKRLSVGRESAIVLGLAVIVAVFFLISVLAVLDLTYRGFSVAWLVENVKIRTDSLVGMVTGGTEQSGMKFFLTQFAAVILTGGALAASGAVYQGVFHNPAASPTLLGVQSGGLLGQAVYSLFFLAPPTYSVISYEDRQAIYDSQNLFERYTGQFFVLAGCFIAVAFVMTAAKLAGRGRISVVTLILSGTVFSSIINSLITVLQYNVSLLHGSGASAAASLTTASFGSMSHPQILLLMAVPVLLCLTIVHLMSGRINIIVFGEDEAKSMGMNVGRQRLLLIILSTVLTAVILSFCGQIAFIGLIAPNAARKIVGPDYKYLMPASTLMGALLLLTAYDISYMIGFSASVGNVTSIAGGIIFFIIMTVYRRQKHGDWA